MIRRYLLASFFGGLIGAGCVLVIVYVTNTQALVIHGVAIDAEVAALHSRINDFYIFAGIVITLLLAINVGVFVKADDEVDKQIENSFGKRRMEIDDLVEKCQELYTVLDSKTEKHLNPKSDDDEDINFRPGNG